jgi:hypothetical protein
MRSSVATKLKLSFVLCGLGLMLVACSPWYVSETTDNGKSDGLTALWRGDYAKARDIFDAEHQRNPNDLYPTLNLADTYLYLQDRDKAVPLFQKLAAGDHNQHPERQNDMKGNPTFTEIACLHLKELQVSDPNCR